MAITPVFKTVPKDVVEWGRFFRNATNVEGTITHEQLEDSAALSVLGRSANTSGSPDDIAASGNNQVLVTRAGVLGFNELADADIPATIARDAEVSAAIVAHEAASNPHPTYTDATELAAAITAHEAASDPHPTYTTAAELSAAIAGAVSWATVKKTANETITSDATLNNDAALKFAMLANTKYSLRGRIFFDTSAAADFKYRHTGPASPTLVRIHRRELNPSGVADVASTVDTAYSAADIAVTSVLGTDGGYIELDGIIHNGANAGDFQIQWAQNTSDASNTIVRAGSYLEYMTT